MCCVCAGNKTRSVHSELQLDPHSFFCVYGLYSMANITQRLDSHCNFFFFLIQTYLFKDKGIVYFSYGANQEIFNCF